MIPEAELKEADAGLVPASVGWFVLNAREARWFDKPGQGHSCPLTGDDEFEAETYFPMLGMAIRSSNPTSRSGRTTGRPSRRTSSCSPAKAC